MKFMKKITLFLVCLVFAGVSALNAQNVQVSGVVTDSNGEKMFAVSVVVEGTRLGVTTDDNGRYSISVPSNATLTFSFIGMKTIQEPVNGRSIINVTMETATTQIDELIVVAFGTTKKSAFTGSATVLNTEDIAKHVSTNIANVLVGSVPGVQMRGSSGAPGAGSGSINIRGINSMYANTDPLVIVDGSPYPANLANIPQGDIESITVLKDAASAALYGARGGAGVILVTTKRGKSKTAVINVDVKMGVNSRIIQDYDVIKDPGQYYEAYYSQVYNYYFLGQGQSAALANSNANTRMINDLGYNVYTVPTGELLIGMDGKLNPKATLGRRYVYNGTEYCMQPDDWAKLAYKNGLRQEYNVSLSGSADRSSFYASIGYLNEEGIIDNSDYKRLTARLRSEYQAKSWLKLSGNVGYVNSDMEENPNMSTSSNSTNLMYYTTMIAPIYPAFIYVVDANGNVVKKKDERGHDAYDYGVASTNYGYQRAFLQTGNPLGSNRYNKVNSLVNQLNANFSADANITSYLKANVTSSVTWGQTNYSDYQNPFYGPKVGVNGTIEKSSTTAVRTNNTQTLTYFKDFGQHSVNVMLGHDYYKTTTKYLAAFAQGGFSPDIPEINAFAKVTDGNSYTSKYNVEGFLGSVQYNYAEKYFGSLSYRRDASSYFKKENQWGDFWAIGGAWLLSKESFLENLKWIDMLKLKASIGQQGKDNVGSWRYVDMYALSPSSETTMSPSFSVMGNPNITWETTTNFSTGIEFALFENRLVGSIEYYNKKISDLLFWLSVPESAGSRGYYDNIGDMRNTGVEVALTGTVVRTKNIQWNVSLNLSHNADRILSLPESKVTDKGGFTENSRWYKVGGCFYNSMYKKFAGVNEQGVATYWVDEDVKNATNIPGKKHSYTTTIFAEASTYEIGDLTPKVFGGFGTTLRIYDFDLSFTFDYQLGGKIFDTRYQNLMAPNSTGSASAAGANIHVDYIKSWSPNNTSSTIPRWQYLDQYGSQTSDRFLTNASYLNFQSFTIGYTLPKNLIKGVSKMRIYAAGENLGFWSARKGLDPRYSFTGNTYVAVYSPVRNISGGIQITF